MSIEKMLSLQRWDCVPYRSAQDGSFINNMTLKVFQEHDPQNYTTFSVKLSAPEGASFLTEQSTGHPCEYDVSTAELKVNVFGLWQSLVYL